MRLQGQSIIVLLWLLLSSCGKIHEQSFFNFPVREIEDTLTAEPLVPKPYFGPLLDPVLNFTVVDSFIIVKTDGVDSSIILFDRESHQQLGRMLKKGRGPNEFLYLLDSFESDGTHLDLYDMYKGSILSLDINNSLFSGATVVSEYLQLSDAKMAPFTHFHRLPDGSVILYDTANSLLKRDLVGIPDFIKFDKDGNKEKGYQCFKDIPMKTKKRWAYSAKTILSISECMSPEKDRLCFAMWRMPQLNIMNIRRGDVVGVRISGKRPFTYKRSDYHFVSVCADSDHIYALYFGEEADRCYSGSAEEFLYVFDWDGNVQRKYILDGIYPRCSLFNNQIILSREDGQNTYLYCTQVN